MFDDVWIIVPAYNEGPRLDSTLRSLCIYYTNVVVVDDGSRDRSRQIMAQYPVWRLSHVVNCGQGAALQTGIDFALDHGADRGHLRRGRTALCGGYPAAVRADPCRSPGRGVGLAVSGNRRGHPLGSLADVEGRRPVYTLVLGHASDRHAQWTARCCARQPRIQIRHNRMAHASEILDQIRQLGLTYGEIPITVRYTSGTLTKGQSSWNGLRIVGQLLLGRFTR